MSDTLLVIEGRHADVPSLQPSCRRRASTSKPLRMAARPFHDLKDKSRLVVVNAASLRSTGIRICRSIRNKNAKYPIVLVLAKGPRLARILLTPYGLPSPHKACQPDQASFAGDGKNVSMSVRCGWMSNTPRALPGQDSKLTPRLATLLQLLMDKHGEVVEREALFKKVWETNTRRYAHSGRAHLLAAPRH